MTERETIFDAIDRERLRQETLKAEGKFRYTLADPQMGAFERIACLTEELGEVARASLGEARLAEDGGDVTEELVQLAACCVAWLESRSDR